METKHDIKQFKGQTRLPKYAMPKHYDLHLSIDLVTCTFLGKLQIHLDIVEETKFLVLNALELDINLVCFTNSVEQKKKNCPVDVVLDADDEILVLVFDQVLELGGGVLGIEYSGMLNNQLKGLYKCTRIDGEERKNMAATQFEAVEARRCFPCWDEPALKCTFKIPLDVPPEIIALSNMPIMEEKLNGNVKTVYFKESPLMSTYLVAIVVGLFDHIEDTATNGTTIRAYCPPGKSDQGKYALHIAVKALELYTEYFSMPYPLPKLDLVAVPEFSGGAMENYGLIIYRENEMLHDYLLSTAAKKQRLTIVALHEVAHMWFGNLVTMEWWTHLWLNEGFATWVSYMATDKLFPEWKIWAQFLQLCSGGLHTDALEKSHPIEVEIKHAREVLEIFDSISYKKGSAVIRMLEGYLGDEIFRKSLSSYIQQYAWKNARTEDLWSVMTEESGIQVDILMDTWTKQKGYPVISVKLNGHMLEFEQSPFASFGSHDERHWVVPITLSIGSYARQKKFLLETKSGEVDIADYFDLSRESSSKDEEELDEQMWIKVNVDPSGFYRVKYEDKLVAQLMKATENACLSAMDKFGILDDAYALCEARQQSLSSLLLLIDVYRTEVDYVVLSKLIDVCYDIMKISLDAIPGSMDCLKQLFINILQLSAERLGWEPIPGETHLDVLLRGEVLTALANYGDEKIQKEELRRFESLLNDKNTALLSADTKRAVYISVMKNATTTNRKNFDSLLSIYRETDTLQERERILRFIASSPDPEIVSEVLKFLVSDEVRDQDIIYGFVGISLEGREPAWKWLKDNWDFILEKYGTGVLFTHFIVNIITLFASEEKADEVEAFFATRKTAAFAKNLEQSIEQVRVKARLVQSIKQEESLHELIKQLASKG